MDAEAGGDSNSGTSPEDAWLTITHALTSVRATSQDAAVIHIAAGTYSASTNDETFPLQMKSYVSLVGASADTTILDAEGAAYHVIYCGSVRDATIEGLTVQGGSAYGSEIDYLGGGICCRYCSTLRIEDCTVADNSAVWVVGLPWGHRMYYYGLRDRL